MCNKQLACSQESYERLESKGKITQERKEILYLLCKYRFLTLEMAAFLLQRSQEELYEDMEALSDYGLVLKQFYECVCEDEPIRTQTFYCASPSLPAPLSDSVEQKYHWEKGLRLEDAMRILAYNQFHIALTECVPKKAIQAQMDYNIKGVIVEGRYRLKSKKYYLGYSHLMVLAVRDFAAHNSQVTNKIKHILSYYAYREENTPWFVIICENKVQCAYLSRKLKADPDTRDASVFFILDTDIELNENPLHVLQTFQYANEDQEIVVETYRISDWF